MRKLLFVAAAAGGVYGLVRWWRVNRRVGADFVNRIVNPWLERRGYLLGTHGSLALLEHVGRTSGTVRRTPIYPIPTTDGFRVIIPIGERSQWARNVLAAGHCRLIVGNRTVELADPMLETPGDVAWLPRLLRFAFDWLGFRYLHLRTTVETQRSRAVPAIEAAPLKPAAVERVAVPA